MPKRLFVGVLGHRNSGKSTTWNTLFDTKVRTGKQSRILPLKRGECVEVFLISGSPEERQIYAGDILGNQDCRIVLCSIQYTEAVRETLGFVTQNRFDLFVHWLNPGHNEVGENYDSLGLMPWLLGHRATVAIRNGHIPPTARVKEIRQFIHGWAIENGLTFERK
jgi:hypothetical protein